MAKRLQDLRHRGPDPLLAAALSTIWPGLGHFGHNTRRALLLINTTLAAIATGLSYTATRSVATLLAWSVTRSSLYIFIAGAMGVLVFRVVVAVDAYRTAASRFHPRRRSMVGRIGTGLTLVVLAVVIAARHFIMIQFANAQLVLLSRVFDATDTQTATPTPIPVTPTSATPNTVTEPDGPVSETTPTSSTTFPSATAPPVTWNGSDRLPIALLGSDGGFDRRRNQNRHDYRAFDPCGDR